MIKLIIDKKSIMIPSCWEDLNITSVIYYLRYYYTELPNLIETNEEGETFIKDEIAWRKMQLGLLRGLIPYTDDKYFSIITSEIANELIEEHTLVDFMTNELLPLPQIIKNLKGFFAPIEFSYLSTAEFAFADIQYLLAKDALKEKGPLAEEKLIECLALLAAILYRERRYIVKFGDNRVVFDKNTVEARADRLRGSRKWILLSIMLWYESNRRSLPLRYPNAFESSSGEGDGGLPDWQGAMLTVAESGTFGDFYAVEKTPVLYFIKEIDRKRKQIKEQIEAAKNSTR